MCHVEQRGGERAVQYCKYYSGKNNVMATYTRLGQRSKFYILYIYIRYILKSDHRVSVN